MTDNIDEVQVGSTTYKLKDTSVLDFARGNPTAVSTLGIDTAVSSGSGNLISSGAVASYVTSSVDGVKRYFHSVYGTYSSYKVAFQLVSSIASAINTYAKAASALYNAGFNSSTSVCPASGYYSSYSYNVYGVYASNSSTITLLYNNGSTASFSSSASFYDPVIAQC